MGKVSFRAGSAANNTGVGGAYRGAGRPEAASLIERAMDMLALELKMDAAELRGRNLITGPFPYTTAGGVTYDSGDYARVLDVALRAAGYDALRIEQKARRSRGDRLQMGIGISGYLEITGGGTPMGASMVRCAPDGIAGGHSR